MTTVCGALYVRPLVLTNHQITEYPCHYLAGHTSDRHSWFALELSDSVEIAETLERLKAEKLKASQPPLVNTMLDAITDGLCDEYLEALLAAAHGRKRQIRGIRRPYGLAV